MERLSTGAAAAREQGMVCSRSRPSSLVTRCSRISQGLLDPDPATSSPSSASLGRGPHPLPSPQVTVTRLSSALPCLSNCSSSGTFWLQAWN